MLIGREYNFIFVENEFAMSVFSIIWEDIKDQYYWLKDYLYFYRQSREMNKAIKLADIRQQAENKQVHVMLIDLPQGECLIPVSRNDIQTYKRKGWIPKQACMISLKNDSIFYSTPLNRNNKSTPEERKAAKKKYLEYAKKYMQR